MAPKQACDNAGRLTFQPLVGRRVGGDLQTAGKCASVFTSSPSVCYLQRA
jgi:hypothetical protein